MAYERKKEAKRLSGSVCETRNTGTEPGLVRDRCPLADIYTEGRRLVCKYSDARTGYFSIVGVYRKYGIAIEKGKRYSAREQRLAKVSFY